ncbi:MAG: RDD family protein [Steroidobacteraceae bacterium]
MRPSNTFELQNVERQASLAGAPLATFLARAAAFIIDAIIVGLLVALPMIWDRVTGAAENSPTLSLEFGGWLSVIVAVAYFALSTYIGKGYTIGKRLLRIRVVSLTHGHMSMWHCVERALGYAASFLEGGFGFLQYFIHPNHQTVHDRIAETIVVAAPRRKPAGATS